MFVVSVRGLLFLCFWPLFCSFPACLTCVVDEKLKIKQNKHQNSKKQNHINTKGAAGGEPGARGGGASPELINLFGARAAGGRPGPKEGQALY